ncbi:MAG: DNA polymerase III subunit delta' [Mangrovicoccus sp.]
MSEADPLPEADCRAEALHPRFAPHVIGHDDIRAQIFAAIESQEMHHAWLLTGPEGIGKATLAWAMARCLLAAPVPGAEEGLFGPEPLPFDPSLCLSPDHPISHRVKALSEPRLSLVRRRYDSKAGRFQQNISVEDIRQLKRGFTMASTEPGYRVAIIDSADDMNIPAANALLKLLEEPPLNTILLLISHRPSRLLPTIRSRCRMMRLAALDAGQISQILAAQDLDDDSDEYSAQLARLSEGSAGRALTLLAQDGMALQARLLALLGSLPNYDRSAAWALADHISARDGEEKRHLMLDLLEQILGDLARFGVTQALPYGASPEEGALFARLSPNPMAGRAWAQAQQEIPARARIGLAVNLDPGSLTLDMVRSLERTAQTCLPI